MKNLTPLLLILLAVPSPGGAEPQALVPPFANSIDNMALAAPWTPLFFANSERHTSYKLRRDEGRLIIEAKSDNAASGLIYKRRISPEQYGHLKWSWKIEKTIPGGNVFLKSGDDYAARIYITFAYEPSKVSFFKKIKYETIKLFYGEYPPSAALAYIWANVAPQGLIVASPFTDQVKMIVVQSGADKAGRWQGESRDIMADYQQAFGARPGQISGIAIMTDTDNTHEKVTAWYGNIELNQEPPE